MNVRRLALYLALLIVLAAGGFALTYWALFACAPPALPGDELWTARQNLGEAARLVLTLGSKTCFTGNAAGSFALWLGTRTAGVLLVGLALAVLWELVGRELRLGWFRARGGHVVLAGTSGDVAELARRQGRLGGTFFLAPDHAASAELARHRPFAEIATVNTLRLPRQLGRLGAPKARLLAAATPNDLTNVAIAEAGLGIAGEGELLVRLEQHAVRNLSSHRLRIRAAEQGRTLAVVSLTQLQSRRASAAAMSGRYTIEGSPRVHIALCGSGPALQAASFDIARQGFGLEESKPVLSILRTGTSDFAAGALQRLQASEIAEVRVIDVLSAVSDGLDRAIGATVQDAPPLLAVHCIGESSGEAEAMALRWEDVLLTLHQPVPPIIAYGSEDRPLGSTGMIRVATSEDLAKAREAAQLMDQRARAVHQHFLDAQRATRGDKFGSAPAEVDWLQLPESFQDDNRNVADQMEYKLARVFMLVGSAGAASELGADEVEGLAKLAHARWWAAKALSGWRFGEKRDDRAMLHPDMMAYERLSELVKQKDRDEVASLASMAKLGGEALKRERRIGVPRPLERDAYDILRINLAATPKAEVPVAVLPLDDASMLPLARALLDDGVLVEIIVDHWTDELRRERATADDLAGVLRRAWRIHVTTGEARSILEDRVRDCVDQSGAIDALA